MSDPANSTCARQSRLDDGRYGYDFVVALTQKAVNATMKEYLYKLGKRGVTTTRYISAFIGDADISTEVNTADFIKNKLGFDPFDASKLPDGIDTDSHNPNADKLSDAGFDFGLEMTMGLPTLRPGQSFPDIVDFSQGIDKVTYTMTFAHISVITFSPSRRHGTTIYTVHRHDQKPGEPWEFQVLVNLDLSPTATKDLPPDVVSQFKDCGGDLSFGVQQLLFDLNSTRLQSAPIQLQSIDPKSKAYDVAREYFLNAYLGTMKAQGSPVLSYVAKQNQSNATYIPTNLALAASPVVGSDGSAIDVKQLTEVERGVNTLDYLCVIDNHPLPQTIAPTWNWINPDESKQSHGVIAIKHSIFMQRLAPSLIVQAQNCCVWPIANSHAKTVVLYTDPVQWSKDDDGASASQLVIDQSVQSSGDGMRMFHASFEQSDSGCNGSQHDPICAIDIKWSYSMDVLFRPDDDSFSIKQNLTVHLKYRSLSTTEEGDIVSRAQNTTVKFAPLSTGELQTEISNNLVNNDQQLNTSSANDFFLHINDKIAAIEDRVKLATPDLSMLHIDKLRGFVFPGGKVFSFKKVQWADSGDLLTYITYADPAMDGVTK